MATLPIKPLDGAGGYLRWKESLLLRVRTLGVAHVLFEPRPAPTGAAAAAAADEWARDDEVCRGHILAALSDRLLPDYARFAAAGDLWRALARTYDLTAPPRARFDAFMFTFGSKDVLLEEIAHAEALGAAAELPDDVVARELCGKLPDIVGNAVLIRSGPRQKKMAMSLVWDVARSVVASDAGPTCFWSSLYNDC